MTGPWAARVPVGNERGLAALRLVPGLEVAELTDGIWLRGSGSGEELDRALRCVPDLVRFAILEGGLLRPVLRLLPDGHLPVTTWRSIDEWAAPEPQPAAIPGEVGSRLELRLVPSAREEPAGALVAAARDWRTWAALAASVRLDPLTFAAAADGRVLVRGTPLPPLPGTRCTDREGLVVPAGWTWTPAVGAAVVAGRLGLEPGDAALFDAGGTWELVPADAFVPATRPAVRATFLP